ncbi:MAG: cohesin domain-containing protein, partial [Acutalibacteraceae bacterium]
MIFWKKLCSILLATLLVLGTGTLASAAEEPTLRVVSVTAHPGESVDVAVEIVNNPGIIAALVQISYDPDALTLTAVQDGGLLGTGTMVPGGDKTAVPYNVLWSDSLSTTNHTQDGTLVTFTFQVREGAPLGDTTITLTCNSSSCFNCDLQPVSFRAQSGTVTVTSAGAHTHEYNAVVTAPTCTEKGYTTYTCSVCGDSYTDDETEMIPHDYKAVVTAPTCTEKGYTTYTCSVCGDSYTDDETEMIPHDYKAVVTAPTCTEKGYTTYTCSV